MNTEGGCTGKTSLFESIASDVLCLVDYDTQLVKYDIDAILYHLQYAVCSKLWFSRVTSPTREC